MIVRTDNLMIVMDNGKRRVMSRIVQGDPQFSFDARNDVVQILTALGHDAALNACDEMARLDEEDYTREVLLGPIFDQAYCCVYMPDSMTANVHAAYGTNA